MHKMLFELYESIKVVLFSSVCFGHICKHIRRCPVLQIEA